MKVESLSLRHNECIWTQISSFEYRSKIIGFQISPSLIFASKYIHFTYSVSVYTVYMNYFKEFFPCGNCHDATHPIPMVEFLIWCILSSNMWAECLSLESFSISCCADLLSLNWMDDFCNISFILFWHFLITSTSCGVWKGIGNVTWLHSSLRSRSCHWLYSRGNLLC